MPIPKDDKRIRLVTTAFVIYYHANLAKARQFFLDFGMTISQETSNEISFAGYGSNPVLYIARQASGNESRFGGAAYEVETRSELERAASTIPGASAITPLHAPGGGEMVTLTDPAGHPVHLVYGQTPKSRSDPGLEKLTFNYEDEKPRRGKFQRFTPGPAPVHRWGHYGVTYPAGQYSAMYEWYTSNLALAPSDVVLRVAHAAFEVHDFDIQQLGHQFLQSRGYELCWGVGRHVLGSQVFDYWFDTSGFMVEHFADGDIVNIHTPVAEVQAGPQALSIWGPPVPPVF
ncbi:uncharacterized protein AB675_10459 [Cyphellophora attinorum]|uniref:VOC domain-containing protein n=1 Tax=Cyphellophora attinorum TaxID=1664694 RepID=A0A0N1HMF4_9EURO|nr:uncharacterized protein AB675_10459 [Phialophora attinorum]KPI35932.1 hypothetical protein AB675_10459 [Phialophora attinorum]